MKLIIAEDNKIEQKNIVSIVEQSGLDIEVSAVFSNGRDALDYICDNKTDIIISDIQMPHFNGIDLLKAINEKNLQTKVIFVSCHDNPEYLITAIENNAASYILKPIKKAVFLQTLEKVYNSVKETKNLQKQLKKAEELKNFAIEKQLRDLIFSPSDVTENILFDEFQNFKYIAVAVIGIEDYNPYFDSQPDGVYEMSMITRYILELNYDGIELYPLIINAQSIAVILIARCENIDIPGIFDKFYDYVLTNFGICVKIGISDTEKDIMQLNSMYVQATDALAYSEFTQEKTVISYNTSLQSEFPFKLIEIVNETEKLLLNPSESKVTELIDHYLGSPNLSGTYIQKFSYSFVHSIELNLNKYGKSLENLTGIEIWNKLSSYNSEANTKKLLYNIFFAAYELLTDNITDNNSNSVVEIIKTIIAENYQDRITTEYLSKKINYSPRYLSLIFKNETGKTILQYLTEFRIEKAKELLKEKDSKVYHVANNVGYTRNSHFNNVFKKHVGISPYEYKEKYTD